MTILFVIESPGKVAKISGFLGKNYLVKASMGHFRDLDSKSMSIDFDNNFEPIYVITKPDVVKNLKAAMKKCDMVYIATDNDVEGFAIAQSIYDVLRPKKYKRLTFNAITKKAIMTAIENAGTINKDLVNAQKTRRVLDRLYGYLISPVLQRQIGGSLSAGRVQSVATEIVIDRENEIKAFIEKNTDSTFFKVTGHFSGLKSVLYESMDKDPHTQTTEYKGKPTKILLTDTDKPYSNITTFLEHCLTSKFIVHSVTEKVAHRSPSAPFTTSTLQQEANRKFGMPVDLTMRIAQKLYEAGYITYMRTDSVEISAEAHEEIKDVIIKEFGKKYYQKNVYKNKSANAQEAHEAIRPVHADLQSLDTELGESAEEVNQIKLYRLIWQRTIASQMKPADINVTTIQITISKYLDKKINSISKLNSISKPYYYFTSQLEKIIFLGFMKVYVESVDDTNDDENDTVKDFDGKIPKVGDVLEMTDIIAKQEFLRPPCRYTEASLVKKLEGLGIGRPSTFVNTIKTIKDRGYVEIGNVAGIKKDIMTFSIDGKPDKKTKPHTHTGISEKKSTILIGKENKKMLPTGLGITVNDFLMIHFAEMMDYKFTANMEKELDDIATGDKVWHKVIAKFYNKLNPIIEELKKTPGIVKMADRLLGKDANGYEIYVTKNKFGTAVKKMIDNKPYCEKIEPDQLETIKLTEAIKLLRYPIVLGKLGQDNIYVRKGKNNLYLQHGQETYSMDAEKYDDTITLDEAIKLIQEKKADNIAEFDIVEGKKKIKAIVLKGKYGPYILAKREKSKQCYKIPYGVDPTDLTVKQVKEIISQKKKPYSSGSKTVTKKPATKKPATKKPAAKKPAAK